MGNKKEHQKKLVELAIEIISLGETVKEIEKHMESIWTDEIERDDLRHLKEQSKKMEDSLCGLQEEIGHLEKLHCNLPR
jgi:hypothetical protein